MERSRNRKRVAIIVMDSALSICILVLGMNLIASARFGDLSPIMLSLFLAGMGCSNVIRIFQPASEKRFSRSGPVLSAAVFFVLTAIVLLKGTGIICIAVIGTCYYSLLIVRRIFSIIRTPKLRNVAPNILVILVLLILVLLNAMLAFSMSDLSDDELREELNAELSESIRDISAGELPVLLTAEFSGKVSGSFAGGFCGTLVGEICGQSSVVSPDRVLDVISEKTRGSSPGAIAGNLSSPVSGGVSLTAVEEISRQKYISESSATDGAMPLENPLYVTLIVIFCIPMVTESLLRIVSISFSQIQLKVLQKIIRKTYAVEVLFGLLILIISFSFVLVNVEGDNIASFEDALWYCFAIVTTTGFGDITAQSRLGRVLSVFIGTYGIIVVALITSIIVNFYNEVKNDPEDEDERSGPAEKQARIDEKPAEDSPE